MKNLKTIDLKAFVPSKDYELSKQFYLDMGFTQASEYEGVSFFHAGDCRFLLQNFYDKSLADNLMMHLLVEDVNAWYEHIAESQLIEKYQIKVTEVSEQPWGMLDFVIIDPSGVLWRIGQNI